MDISNYRGEFWSRRRNFFTRIEYNLLQTHILWRDSKNESVFAELSMQYYNFLSRFYYFTVQTNKYVQNIRINNKNCKIHKICPLIPKKRNWKSKERPKIRLRLKAFQESQARRRTW